MGDITKPREQMKSLWMSSGVDLWVEDDALPGGVKKAFDDLWKAMGEHHPKEPRYIIDLGDAHLHVYVLSKIVVFELHSYPGNSRFSVANREK